MGHSIQPLQLFLAKNMSTRYINYICLKTHSMCLSMLTSDMCVFMCVCVCACRSALAFHAPLSVRFNLVLQCSARSGT